MQTEISPTHIVPAKGYILYEGPSELAHGSGAPIVVIAIMHSSNAKTGDMVQTYILRSDMDPREASRTGADSDICGACPLKGDGFPGNPMKLAQHRECYVLIHQGPRIVWNNYKAGKYPRLTTPADITLALSGRAVRIGAYGDGAAAPSWVWAAAIKEAAGHTAYTHQWDLDAQPGTPYAGNGGWGPYPWVYMASVDTLDEAHKAWARGYRTFRVVNHPSELDPQHEIVCPNETTGVQCIDCRLCSGNKYFNIDPPKSIVITVHGSGKKYFPIRQALAN
jgi:hypothetical protein